MEARRFTRYRVRFNTRAADAPEVDVSVFTSGDELKATAMATGNLRLQYPEVSIASVDVTVLDRGLMVGDVEGKDVVDRYEL